LFVFVQCEIEICGSLFFPCDVGGATGRETAMRRQQRRRRVGEGGGASSSKEGGQAAGTPVASARRADLAPLVRMLSPVGVGTPAGLRQRYRATGQEAGRGRFATVSILEAACDKEGKEVSEDEGKDGEEEEGAGGEKERRLFAMKRQPLQSPPTTADVSVREWRIFQRLAELAARGMCFNFVHMVDSFVERRAEDRRRYVDLVLEYADSRLDIAGNAGMGVREVKEIGFQLVWALVVGQREEIQFVHNDLHSRNVLLQRCSNNGGGAAEYHAGDGRVWYTTRWVVKITDFGLSRVTLADGSVVFNPKHPFGSAFVPTTDIESVRADLDGIKLDGWDANPDGAKQRLLFKSFKRALSKASMRPASLSNILSHEFFVELQQRPDVCTLHLLAFISVMCTCLFA